jgi:hypothetical protein
VTSTPVVGAVPEPASVVLLVSGAPLLFVFARKRRKQTNVILPS